MKMKNFEYDPELDSLHIYTDSEDKIEGSISIGNFIFDISTSGKYIGLEIENASSVLNASPEEIVSNIQEANIKVVKQKNVILLMYFVLIGKRELTQSLVIPKNKIALTC
jgi:uncharacterized protein YuzE